MEKLKEFVKKNDCDFSKFLPSEDLVNEAEKVLNIKFGEQLRKYLLTYGYLGYKYIMFAGLVANMGLKSDLVGETLANHKYFKETEGLIYIEDQGDADYYMIDSDDFVYRICPGAHIFEKLNIKLFDYMLERFECAKNNDSLIY